MQQVQPTTTISVDDTTYNISDLSNEVQHMVLYLDQWRQDEVDVAAQLLKTRAAIKDLQNTILMQLQHDLNPSKEEEVVE